jgi:hypothetical protein
MVRGMQSVSCHSLCSMDFPVTTMSLGCKLRTDRIMCCWCLCSGLNIL